MASAPSPAGIDLYWLPLGAGGHYVRLNGKVFEWFAARFEHPIRRDLYHSALQVYLPEGRFVIEQGPAWGEGSQRGVAAEGADVPSGAPGSFATRFAAGARASFPTSPRPSKARDG